MLKIGQIGTYRDTSYLTGMCGKQECSTTCLVALLRKVKLETILQKKDIRKKKTFQYVIPYNLVYPFREYYLFFFERVDRFCKDVG